MKSQLNANDFKIVPRYNFVHMQHNNICGRIIKLESNKLLHYRARASIQLSQGVGTMP